jgi:predicted NAD/FAD-binding protein
MVNREEEIVMMKMVNFANEFLRVAHDIKKESNRPDQLPEEVQEYLANKQLDDLIKEDDLEPEMLVWGLVNIIEILIKYSQLDPSELHSIIAKFIEMKKDELNG